MHLLNAAKKLSRLMRNLSLTKRTMLLISKNDIPGCKRVLEAALSRGASPGVVLSKLEDALAGVYKARRWNETENDLALMVLRLGGPALLHVLHQTSGLPSLTYTRKLGRKVSNWKDLLSLHHALWAMFLKLLASESGNRKLFRMAVDEIAVNEVAAWDQKTNMVLCGQCTQNAREVKLEFDTIDDVDNLAEKLDAGEVHLSKELTVIFIAPFGSSSAFRAIPVFALGSCKKPNEQLQTAIFEEVSHF
ncbi:unnamed protein product [Scytosiphon promiscuus]